MATRMLHSHGACARAIAAPPMCRANSLRRSLWMAAWSGDHKKFDRKWLAAASEAEQRQLITNMDPESGWNAMHHAAVGGREKMLNTMLDACPRPPSYRRLGACFYGRLQCGERIAFVSFLMF